MSAVSMAYCVTVHNICKFLLMSAYHVLTIHDMIVAIEISCLLMADFVTVLSMARH